MTPITTLGDAENAFRKLTNMYDELAREHANKRRQEEEKRSQLLIPFYNEVEEWSAKIPAVLDECISGIVMSDDYNSYCFCKLAGASGICFRRYSRGTDDDCVLPVKEVISTRPIDPALIEHLTRRLDEFIIKLGEIAEDDLRKLH